MKKFLEYGGIAASVLLIAFGIGATVVGISGRDRVQTELAREQIVGTPDSTIPNQLVNTGSEAQAFAKVMRKHTLEATGGKTYSQMPRFASADGKGTNDEKAALKNPKSGGPRSTTPRGNLGHRDRAVDRAQHRLLRGEHGHLRDRDGHRDAPHGDRVPGPHARRPARPRRRQGEDPDDPRQGGRRPALSARAHHSAVPDPRRHPAGVFCISTAALRVGGTVFTVLAALTAVVMAVGFPVIETYEWLRHDG